VVFIGISRFIVESFGAEIFHITLKPSEEVYLANINGIIIENIIENIKEPSDDRFQYGGKSFGAEKLRSWSWSSI